MPNKMLVHEKGRDITVLKDRSLRLSIVKHDNATFDVYEYTGENATVGASSDGTATATPRPHLGVDLNEVMRCSATLDLDERATESLFNALSASRADGAIQ